MELTKKQYSRLKKYDGKLYTALYCDFVRLVDRTAIDELDEVFRELFPNESGVKSGCSRCVLKAVKKLAERYFKDKKTYQEIGKIKKTKEKEKENGNDTDTDRATTEGND
jgi:DNA-binding Lrp family transcriptional regulator